MSKKYNEKYSEIAKNNLAIFLKDYRFKKDINQTQLAKILGMHSSTISALENGQRNISFEMIFRISERLSLSIDSILGLQNPVIDLSDFQTDELLRELYKRIIEK